MLSVENILSPERLVEYHEKWNSFTGRYAPETEYHTRSGRPVIGQVFRFEEEPIFRAHVFGDKRLVEIDPYFMARKYLHTHWHIAHYLIVAEQMYHASMHLLRDTDKLIVIDVPKELELSKPIFMKDNVSIEFIWQPKRQAKKYSIEDCHFALYDDKIGQIKGRVSATTFVQPRPHITTIERLKQGDGEAVEALVRQIEGQAKKHGRLLKQRENLPSKEFLIGRLRSGNIPEKELLDYFSLWDTQIYTV